MNVLFLTFANSLSAPLIPLKEEDAAVYRVLTPLALQQHYLLHRDAFATLAEIAEYLTLYRDHITVFHYSGHTDRDVLLLEDQTAQAEGIDHLLGQCKKLQLVLLNGCFRRGPRRVGKFKVSSGLATHFVQEAIPTLAPAGYSTTRRS